MREGKAGTRDPPAPTPPTPRSSPGARKRARGWGAAAAPPKRGWDPPGAGEDAGVPLPPTPLSHSFSFQLSHPSKQGGGKIKFSTLPPLPGNKCGFAKKKTKPKYRREQHRSAPAAQEGKRKSAQRQILDRTAGGWMAWFFFLSFF